MSEHFVNCANQPYAFTAKLITKVHKTELNLKVLFVCDSALCHVEKKNTKKQTKKTPTSFLPPS